MEGNHIRHQFVKGDVSVQLTGGCAAAALNANKKDKYSNVEIMRREK